MVKTQRSAKQESHGFNCVECQANYLKDDKKDNNKNNEETVSIIKRKGDRGKTKSKARRNTARVNSLLNKFRFAKKNTSSKGKGKNIALPSKEV